MKRFQIVGFILLISFSACQSAITQMPQVDEPLEDTPQLMITKSAEPLQVEDATLVAGPTIINDVLYANSLQDGVDDQLLDIYASQGDGTWPVVVFMHGLGNSKFIHTSLSRQMAEAGMIVFTVNWPSLMLRNSSEWNSEGFREMYEVISCAVRYARMNAAGYGGDPSRIILVGFSAGANIGGWHALSGGTLDQTWDDFAAANEGSPAPQVTCVANMDVPVHVNAFIGIGGRYTREDFLKNSNKHLWEIISPLNQIGRYTELRVRLLHGTRDVDVPVEHSEFLHDLLVENGYDTKVVIFDGTHYVPVEETITVIMELAGEQ